MKLKNILSLLLCLFLMAGSLVVPGSLSAQEQADDQKNLEQKFEEIKTERLKRIRKELIQLQNEIYAVKKRMAAEGDLVVKMKLEGELEKLQKERDQRRFLFIETATNINLQKTTGSEGKETNLSQDIKEIINPLIDGIKKISERPRAIQQLKEKIEVLEERLEAASLAEKRLKMLAKSDRAQGLDSSISRSIKTLQELQKSLAIEREDSQFRLLKMETGGGALSNFSYAIFDFFKTKGKNLVLALIVFGVLYWLLRMGKDRFISLFMIRMGKTVEQPGQVHWMKRPLRVFYSLFTFITALFMAVMTLYFLNDWVLVTFIIFLLVGLVWSSRNYVPQYFEQFKIVLNFGAIREGERLVFQDLPWKIKSLGYYCRLVNPALSGGTLRISTKELLSSYSRPINDSEPWFPTRKDDWVELSDGTFGKIVMQSPEFVSLKLIGDQTKTIRTKDFLSMNPTNFSNSFGINITFGVDYSHQDIIFGEVIPNLREHVHKKLYSEFEADKEFFEAFVVEFKDAAASSLDLRIFLKCEGRLGSRKLILERKLKSYLVDACNKFGYIIPFTQLTVHYADKAGEK